MSNVINTNIFSIYAQRQATLTQRSEEIAMDRLASGEHINDARDDPYGLAKVRHQDVQIEGYDQTYRNTNDGVSLLQTADSAMDSIANILQRMRDLAVQGNSSTLSDQQRGNLQTEFDVLQDEALGIIQDTEFNNISVLNRPESKTEQSLELQTGGAFSSLVANNSLEGFQFETATKGYYVGESFSDSVDQSTEIELTGLNFFRMEVDGVASDAVELDIGTKTLGDWASHIETQINADANLAAEGKTVSVSFDEEDQRFVVLSDSEGADSTVLVTFSDAGFLGIDQSGSADTGQFEVASFVGEPAQNRKITVDVDGQPLQTIEFPETIKPIGDWEAYIKKNSEGLQVVYDDTEQRLTLSSLTGDTGSVALYGNARALGFITHDVDRVELNHYDLDDTSNALGTLLQKTESIGTLAGLDGMLGKIDDALAYVNEGRAHFAAVENQLLYVTDNLEKMKTELSDARSMINDTDFAEESAELTRVQLLKEFATAMMAQANQLPQQMLQLFR